MRRCSKCGVSKALEDFHVVQSHGRPWRRRVCKSCTRAAVSAWSRANPEKVSAKNRRWREKHPEDNRERNRVYREQEGNRVRAMERAREWRIANPVRRSEQAARRNALKRGAGGILGGHRPAHVARVMEALIDEPCWYCGGSEKMTVDHVVPLSRGGLHHPENLVPACLACNMAKHNKLLCEWDYSGVAA